MTMAQLKQWGKKASYLSEMTVEMNRESSLCYGSHFYFRLSSFMTDI